MTNSLDVGSVLSQVADLYRRYAGVLLPVAAVLFLVVGLVEYLALEDRNFVLLMIVTLVSLVASYFYTGMVVNLVDDVRDGRLDQSVGQLFSRVTPVLLTLFLASIIAGIGIAIGLVLLIIPGLILLTLWAVVVPAILIERKGVFEAFGRSMELVKGNAFPVFAVIVVLFIVSAVVSTLLSAIGASGGDELRAILSYIGRVLTAPLTALAAAVLFFALRSARGEETAAPPAPTTPTASTGPTSSQDNIAGLGGSS
ncbi:MAG TPA: hypothetical protein VIL49_13480 [Capillimicrobium sp.]